MRFGLSVHLWLADLCLVFYRHSVWLIVRVCCIQFAMASSHHLLWLNCHYQALVVVRLLGLVVL
jgi:hypothetical protein